MGVKILLDKHDRMYQSRACRLQVPLAQCNLPVACNYQLPFEMLARDKDYQPSWWFRLAYVPDDKIGVFVARIVI